MTTETNLLELLKEDPKLFNNGLRVTYRTLTKTETNINELINLLKDSETDLIKLNQELGTLKEIYDNKNYYELNNTELKTIGLININDLFLKNILLKLPELTQLIKNNCLIS